VTFLFVTFRFIQAGQRMNEVWFRGDQLDVGQLFFDRQTNFVGCNFNSFTTGVLHCRPHGLFPQERGKERQSQHEEGQSCQS
jgi:hypothetical protein